MNRRVEFVVTELGRQAEAFVLYLFGALAAKERDLISKRTKQALQAAKDRGQLLGMHGKDEEVAQQVREMGAAEMHAQARSAGRDGPDMRSRALRRSGRGGGGRGSGARPHSLSSDADCA
jgi:DNA invertase Pin-like site-specific DNA recombinase